MIPLAITMLAIGAFCIGYALGKRNRKYPLQDYTGAQSLLYFVHKEKLRHEKDVKQCIDDMEKIKRKFNISIITPNVKDWIEV